MCHHSLHLEPRYRTYFGTQSEVQRSQNRSSDPVLEHVEYLDTVQNLVTNYISLHFACMADHEYHYRGQLATFFLQNIQLRYK